MTLHVLRLFAFLDGKKTVIGFLLLMASKVVADVGIGIWHIDYSWLPQSLDTLKYFGELIGSVGVVDKVRKATMAGAGQ